MKLEEQCWKCSGTGTYIEYGIKGDIRGHSRHPNDGEYVVFRLENACQVCNGTGYSLTEFGDEIMEMVKRHLHANSVTIPDK